MLPISQGCKVMELFFVLSINAYGIHKTLPTVKAIVSDRIIKHPNIILYTTTDKFVYTNVTE